MRRGRGLGFEYGKQEVPGSSRILSKGAMFSLTFLCQVTGWDSGAERAWDGEKLRGREGRERETDTKIGGDGGGEGRGREREEEGREAGAAGRHRLAGAKGLERRKQVKRKREGGGRQQVRAAVGRGGGRAEDGGRGGLKSPCCFF